MMNHKDIVSKELLKLYKHGVLVLGGNKKLKIYGCFNCKSGKRMKRENRMFFQSEAEAHLLGYRPCGHCLRSKYNEWKLSE